MERMHEHIKLQKRDIPAALLAAFPSYRGRTYRLDLKGYVVLCDLSWGGGTRSQYALVSLDGLGLAHLPKESPWDPRAEGKTFSIPPRWAVVEHCIFCGKDLGLRFYINPADAAPLLPKAG